MEKTKLILSSLAIASFLIGSAVNLPLASAQTSNERELYDNNDLFGQLSGAARTLLELKFGKKRCFAQSADRAKHYHRFT
jgi:hypothetical protein